jgi:hypothetical protein
VQIEALSLEMGMGANADRDDEIARRSSAEPGAPGCNADAIAVVGSGGMRTVTGSPFSR